MRCCVDILVVPIILVSRSGACFIACAIARRSDYIAGCLLASSTSRMQRILGIPWTLEQCMHSAQEVGSSRGSCLYWNSGEGSASWPVDHKRVEVTPRSWGSASLSFSIRIEYRASPCQVKLPRECHSPQRRSLGESRIEDLSNSAKILCYSLGLGMSRL